MRRTVFINKIFQKSINQSIEISRSHFPQTRYELVENCLSLKCVFFYLHSTDYLKIVPRRVKLVVLSLL